MLSQAPVCPVLPVRDIERAKKFYTEKLGLKESSSPEPGGVMFDCGQGTKLYLYERPAVKVEHTQVSFAVSDLAAEMTELRAKGVVFEEYDMPGLKTVNGVVDMDGFKAAWFKDSEDNILSLGQSAQLQK
jgi:catechol 2,3-dioxygenase-like lactoylglutathione lyase family enzyme